MVEAPPARRVPPALLAGTIVLGVVIVAVVIALLLVPAHPAPSGGTGDAAGAVGAGVPSGVRDWGRAPQFALPSLEGRRALGPADWRHRPLVLAFWASWCTPCQAEAPVLVRLARRYAPRGVGVLGVDVRDAPPAARQFVHDHAFSFPVVSDPTGTVASLYGVAGLPTVALIGANGHLVSLHPGPLDDKSVPAFMAAVVR